MAEFSLQDYDVSPIEAMKEARIAKKVKIASEKSDSLSSNESQINSRATRPGQKLKKDSKARMFDRKKYGGDSSKISHISAI